MTYLLHDNPPDPQMRSTLLIAQQDSIRLTAQRFRPEWDKSDGKLGDRYYDYYYTYVTKEEVSERSLKISRRAKASRPGWQETTQGMVTIIRKRILRELMSKHYINPIPPVTYEEDIADVHLPESDPDINNWAGVELQLATGDETRTGLIWRSHGYWKIVVEPWPEIRGFEILNAFIQHWHEHRDDA